MKNELKPPFIFHLLLFIHYHYNFLKQLAHLFLVVFIFTALLALSNLSVGWENKICGPQK